MFCPQCGTDNQDTNKFCRQCRADLLVVAQDLRKSLPMLLASKIETTIDEPSERFRRNAIICGIAFLGAAASGWRSLNPGFGWLNWLMAVLWFSGGLFQWLAYRHSLALGPDLEKTDAPTTVPGEASAIKASVQPAFALSYCPACGSGLKETANYCLACGANLSQLRQVNTANTSWLTQRLDRYVRRHNTDTSIKKKMRLFKGISYFYAVLALPPLIENGLFYPRTVDCVANASLFYGLFLWERLFQQRLQQKRKSMATNELPNTSVTHENAPATNPLALPEANSEQAVHSVTEETTRELVNR